MGGQQRRPTINRRLTQRAPARQRLQQRRAVTITAGDQEARARGRPTARAFRVLEQIIRDQRVQLVVVRTRRLGELVQRDPVGDGLQHQLRTHESLVPVIRQQQLFEQFAQRLPGGTLFPDAALDRAEVSCRERFGKLLGAIGGDLHPPQLVRGLKHRGVADIAGGCQLLDIGGEHLQAMPQVARRREHLAQQIHGRFGERTVGILRRELRQQTIDIGLLLVLHDRVFTVRHLVGIAERVPVRHLERNFVTMAFQPDIPMHVRTHLQRCREGDGVVHVMRHHLILVRLAAEIAEAGPGFGFRPAGFDDVGLLGHFALPDCEVITTDFDPDPPPSPRHGRA